MIEVATRPASVCNREARLGERPIDMYSARAHRFRSQQAIFTPTRVSSGALPLHAVSRSSGASPPAGEAQHTARAAMRNNPFLNTVHFDLVSAEAIQPVLRAPRLR